MIRVRHFLAFVMLSIALVLQAAGCAADQRPAEIPAGAREMGTSKRAVFWTAPYPGNVYLYSVTTGQLLYSGQLQRGQTIRASAENNQVTVDNVTVAEHGMVGDHEYKVYFQRIPQTSQSPASPSQTSPSRSAPPQQRAQPQSSQMQSQPRSAAQGSATGAGAAASERTTIITDPGAGTTVITQPGTPAAGTDPRQPRRSQ